MSACRFTVFFFLFFFLALLHNRLLLPSYDEAKAAHFNLAESWTSRNKNAAFSPKLKSVANFFQLQPKGETSFSSLRDRLEKSFGLFNTLDFLTRNSRRWGQWSHLSWQWSIWSVIDTDCWRWWHFNTRAQPTTLSRRCRRRFYCSGTKSCRKEKEKMIHVTKQAINLNLN